MTKISSAHPNQLTDKRSL